jgi:hypothetical protein
VTKDVDIDGDFSVHNVPKMRFGLLRCKSDIPTYWKERIPHEMKRRSTALKH